MEIKQILIHKLAHSKKLTSDTEGDVFVLLIILTCCDKTVQSENGKFVGDAFRIYHDYHLPPGYL